MVETTSLDERGRVTIGKKMAAEYGKHFLIVREHEGILLVPTTGDPLKRLMELGKRMKIKHISAEEINRLATEQAYEEIAAKEKRPRKRY